VEVKTKLVMDAVRCRQIKRYGFRIAGGLLLLICCRYAGAQTHLPAYDAPGLFNSIGFSTWAPLPGYQPIGENGLSHRKWFVSRYAEISAGTAFFPGNSAFYLSAPVGLQLNRRVTPNWYAFGGVYIAPTVAGFDRSFLDPDPAYPGGPYHPYRFGINPGVQMGFMYVNDARTFSISGRFSVEQSSYPLYYPAVRNSNAKR
jgi:hypothetical protein